MRRLMLVALISCSVSVTAQDLLLEDPNKYNLGAGPIGRVVELGGWACGNIVVEDFNTGQQTLTLKVNIPSELYINDAEAKAHLDNSWPLKKGSIHTVRLRGGARFSMYWLIEPVDWTSASPKVRTVQLVIRRHCAGKKCENLCECS